MMYSISKLCMQNNLSNNTKCENEIFFFIQIQDLNIEKGNEKWIHYFLKPNRILVFSYLCLVKRMKKQRIRNLFV